MTQSGGPAAINGFLYQMLQHIDRIATLHRSEHDPSAQLLVLEPRDGGDARAEDRAFRCVEQYKTRTKGTWSVRDVTGVLRDLRRAVRQPHATDAQYRFVTDGRRGRFDEFDVFLGRVRCAQTADDLDDATVRAFSNSLSISDRAFFNYVESETRQGDAPATPEQVADVMHLLSHFQMEFAVTSERLAGRIDKELRRYVPNLGTESGIRDRLVGALMKRLGTGEATLVRAAIHAMLVEAGLSPKRMCKLAKLHRTMSTLTAERLSRLKYDPRLDVRPAPIWPPDKPVLLITGESGVGKTWQLGRLLHSLPDEGRVATLVQVTDDTGASLLASAARDIWQTGLDETTDQTIVAVSHRLRDLNYPARELVLAFDDIRDAAIARHLIAQDWSAWGMRLVLTVPDVVARSLHGESGVGRHPVTDFSLPELRDALARASHSWDELPHDLRRLLRKPILAGIFLRLEHSSFRDSPQSEYEIFEQFWQRIAAKGHPYDVDLAMALGTHVFHSRPYPVPRHSWDDVQLTADAVERLETAGWLRNDGGFVAFAHDRLLNWGVAKSFAHAYASDRMSLAELADSLAKAVEGSVANGPGRLGYVPMDALWLLAEAGADRVALARLVERLEETREFGSYGASLYTRMLPTLSAHAVPVLLQRLREITAVSERDYRVKLIGVGLTTLARQDGVQLREPLLSLLESSSTDSQNVALAALANAPTQVALDRLWDLHRRRLANLTARSSAWVHEDYQATFAALRAAIRQNPDWLRRRLASAAEPPESLPELAYQLNALDHPDAHGIWKDARNPLIDRTPPGKPRSLLMCIARFADAEHLDFVLKHLSQPDDFASSAALTALTIIDPAQALERLADVDDVQLLGFRNRWLPVLLHNQPDLTRRRILELAEADSRGFMRINDLFGERPNQIDEPILRFLLRTLERELHEHLEPAIAGDPLWLSFRLKFLSRITGPELLAVLEAEVNSDLERMITQVACSQVDTPSGRYHDHVFESARRILLAMGGSGLATVLRRQLASNDPTVRSDAMGWAVLCDDREVVQDVVAAVSRADRAGDHDDAARLDRTEFRAATAALAQLGEDEALLEVLESTGSVEVTPELARLRSHAGPMSRQLTANARRVLAAPDATEGRVLSALIVAWVSGDPDMVAPVRAVLRDAAPSGRVARYACIALDDLGDTSDAFAGLVSPILDHEDSARFALQALANAGDGGCRRIAEWLAARPPETYGPLEIAAIRLLHRNPSTRAAAVDAAVDACRHGHALLDLPFEIAAESADADLRDRIVDAAIDSDPINSTHGVRAVEGLAKFDVASAILATQHAISRAPVNKRLCALLSAIAPEAAVRTLVDTAITTKRTVLRRWIGRTLRRLDADEVANHVAAYLVGGNTEQRQAAAETARWLPQSRIAEVLADRADADSNSDVRLEALAAIDAHSDEAVVRQLLKALVTAAPRRRWRLLITILETGDPYLLSDPGDALGLGRALSKLPATFALHANDVLSQRLQKEDRQESAKDFRERTASVDSLTN